MPADPNIVSADQAAPVSDPAATAEAKVGQVLKKGGPPPNKAKLGDDVMLRVTKKGHGKIHDGEGGAYDWNDEVVLPRAIAEAQEENAYGEIIG